MFFIPGQLISFLTFPGVIIHEWAHKKYCDWSSIHVYKVVYFQAKNPPGYVLHSEPNTYSQTFWISVGPLIINSFLAIIISWLATQTSPESFLYYFLLWLAISIGMHAFPSDQDVSHIFEKSKSLLKNGGSFFHYLAYPFYGLIWLANKLRFFWFDFFYALALVSFGGLSL